MNIVNDSLPEIPKSLLEANFDHITYINRLLGDNELTEQFIEGLIIKNEQDNMIVTEKIENLILEEHPELINLSENLNISKDIDTIMTQISQVEQVVSDFTLQTNQANQVKKELENLQFIVECCNLFVLQEENTDSELMFKTLLYDQLKTYKDLPDIQTHYNNFTEKLTHMSKFKILDHTIDAFQFWQDIYVQATQQCSINNLQKFYLNTQKELLQQAFPELFTTSQITKDFSQKVQLFFKLHKNYMEKLPQKIIFEILPARIQFLNLTQKFQVQKPENTYFSEQEFTQKFNFFEQFISQFMTDLAYKISKEVGDLPVIDVIILLQQTQEIQTEINGIQSEKFDLVSKFSRKNDEIYRFIEEQILQFVEQKFGKQKLSTLSKGQIQNFYQQEVYQVQKECVNQVLNFVQLLPEANSGQFSCNFIRGVFSQINDYILSNLSFQHLIPQTVHKFFKRTDFGEFSLLINGQVQQLTNFKSLNSGSLIVVDFSSFENVLTFLIQLLKFSKFVRIFMDKTEQILLSKGYEKLDFDVVQIDDVLELSLLSLISGQFVFSVYDSQNVRNAGIIMQNQYQSIIDQIRSFYDEFDLDSFIQLSYEVILENTASGMLLMIQDGSIINEYSKQIIQFIDENQFVENGVDISKIDKIKNIMIIRAKILSGQTVGRDQFISLLGQQSVGWYNEICG